MNKRRDFLKTSALTAGAFALPSSLSALTAGSAAGTPPIRFVFIRKSNGIRPNELVLPTFSDTEKALDAKMQPMEVDLDKHELPEWLRPLSQHKADLSILQGLSCKMSENGHWSYSSVMGAYKSGRNSLSGIKRATIVERLKATPEGSGKGSMFDDTVVMYFPENGEGHHSHGTEAPFITLAGDHCKLDMVVSYIAYGVYEPRNKDGSHHDWNWWPCKDSGPLSFNKSSAPFATFKDSLSYLKGLDHAGGYGLGGHSSGDVFATGANMSGFEKTNNISIDQLAAKMNGHKTRYPSLVLGTEGGTGSYGSCKTLSHSGPGQPIPSMHKPQEIFNRLFKPYAGKGIEQVRGDLKRQASVLDLMLKDSKRLSSRLGKEDQGKMEEYLDSIRAMEKRVERTSQWTHQPLPNVDTKGLNLEVTHKNPEEYTRCMYDLLYLALQTDATRFASLMLESEHSSGTELWNYATYTLGYKGATHDIAHKRPLESGQWDNWRAKQHAYFLERMRNTPEGDSNMLDQTVVLWGSAHPHASHSTKNYPIQVAGGKSLGFKHGNLHSFEGEKKVPLSNLFVSVLNAVDTPTEKFADSTGEMTEIRA